LVFTAIVYSDHFLQKLDVQKIKCANNNFKPQDLTHICVSIILLLKENNLPRPLSLPRPQIYILKFIYEARNVNEGEARGITGRGETTMRVFFMNLLKLYLFTLTPSTTADFQGGGGGGGVKILKRKLYTYI
jgi:hypothetical protein